MSLRWWLRLAPVLALAGSCLATATPQRAEGCSGFTSCPQGAAWQAFELYSPQKRTPTDQVLVKIASLPPSCPGSPTLDQIVLRAVPASGGAPVEGTLRMLEQTSSMSSPTSGITAAVYKAVWTPKQPLEPNSAYTLHLDAAQAQGSGGSAGSEQPASSLSLTMTTTAGPLGGPKAPLAASATIAPVVAADEVYCINQLGSCASTSEQSSVKATEREKPELTMALTPGEPEDEQPFFVYSFTQLGDVEPTDAAGSPDVPGYQQSDLFPYKRLLKQNTGRCLQFKSRNVVTDESVTVDLPCAGPAALSDKVTTHCDEAAAFEASCKGKHWNFYKSDSVAADLDALCNQSSQSSDESDDGCQVRLGARPRLAGLGLALALAAASLWRRARSRG